MKLLNIILWCTLLMWLVSCDSSDPTSIGGIEEDGGAGSVPVATVDITAPVIIAVDITIGLGDIWDDNVAALDDVDGIISSDVVITGDVVDESTEGSYTLTYDVTDAAGNEAAQVSRVVTVSYCTAAKIADAPYANSNEAPTGDGVGTPYTICSLTQLAAIASNIATDKALDFDLKIDIDAAVTSGWDSGAGWTPIGSVTEIYNGNFNGNNHTISNIFINRPSEYQGFFGRLTGEVSNLKLESANITGVKYVGGIAGHSSRAISYSSVVDSSIIGSSEFVGGIAGANYGDLSNSYTQANVTGVKYVGGIAGVGAYSSDIFNCYSTGNTNGTSEAAFVGSRYVGGIVGYVYGNSFGVITSKVRNSFSTGTVSTCLVLCSNVIGGIGVKTFLQNNYRYTSHAQDTTDSATGADGALNTTLADYYDSTVEPLASWDFDNDWLDNGTTYPTPR